MKHEAKNSDKPILHQNVDLVLFILTYFDWVDKEFCFPLYKKSGGGSDLIFISPNSVYKTNGREIWFGIISINLLISTSGHLFTSTILHY